MLQKIYRWAYNQLNKQRDKVKDELITFVGEMPEFRMIEDYLPKQKGKTIELKDHQQITIENIGINETISMDVILPICEVLHYDVSEIMQIHD